MIRKALPLGWVNVTKKAKKAQEPPATVGPGEG